MHNKNYKMRKILHQIFLGQGFEIIGLGGRRLSDVGSGQQDFVERSRWTSFPFWLHLLSCWFCIFLISQQIHQTWKSVDCKFLKLYCCPNEGRALSWRGWHFSDAENPCLPQRASPSVTLWGSLGAKASWAELGSISPCPDSVSFCFLG